MHVHILGICGTFMGSLAAILVEQGYKVTGCDAGVYPPMSTQLESLGITLIQGFEEDQINLGADLYIVGNAMRRGLPIVEVILSRKLPMMSGPEFLAQYILKNRWVIGVSGTHGKTTTTTMLAWIFTYAGFNPGYLIGGVPIGLEKSAQLGEDPYFIIEADEYDSAFFDKRSKFIHYKPDTLIINNIEFDHADIFRDLADVQRQFHHLLKLTPAHGAVIAPVECPIVCEVLNKGVFAPVHAIHSLDSQGVSSIKKMPLSTSFVQAPSLSACLVNGTSQFKIIQHVVELNGRVIEKELGTVQWSMSGEFNIHNALSAVAAAMHAGLDVSIILEALNCFKGVKRRQEVIYDKKYTIIDDFAHHPTAIATTLLGIREKYVKKDTKLVVLIEPRSASMKMGVHNERLRDALNAADAVYWYQSEDADFDIVSALHLSEVTNHQCCTSIDGMVREVVQNVCTGDVVVVMSNGGFSGIHQKIIQHIGVL